MLLQVGLFDKEINFLTKILFASVIILAFTLVAIKVGAFDSLVL